MLGLSDADIDQLTRDGIIGTEMLMEEQLAQQKRSGRRADGRGTAGTAWMARRTRRVLRDR